VNRYRRKPVTQARVVNTAAVIALVAVLAISVTFNVKKTFAQSLPSARSGAFTGGWCAQGDPTKQASISDNGAFLTLTNENGDTSTGQYQGQNGIVAPGWQFVTGTLSPDGSRIRWSNGTFWARCDTGGGGGYQQLNLTGSWNFQGNRNQLCSIHQHGNHLQLSNQSGDQATGQITGKRKLTTSWNGNSIVGTVTANGNRINWDNGTYWTRIRVYSAPSY
jgi:hypothetical protein